MGNQKDIHTALAAPFEDGDIEWRLQWNDKDKARGIGVPYITNRAIQTRLDVAIGINNWKNEYIPWHSDGKKASQLCGISLRFDDSAEWITKYDGADDSDIEPIKGGLSDSMKRAAVQWGIGRYLYGMDTVYVETESRGSSWVIKKTEYGKLEKAHREHVARFFKKPAQEPNAAPAPLAPRPAQIIPRPLQKSAPAEPPLAQNEYLIIQAKSVANIKRGSDTTLQIQDGSGKSCQVYVQGADARLIPGTVISGCKIARKMRDEIVFYILEQYQIAENSKAA